MSQLLYPWGKRPSIHCTGGWQGPRGSLDGCRKSRLHWDSITRLCSESVQQETKVDMVLLLCTWFVFLFREQQDFVGPSFETISAVGPHAAVVHYTPSENTDIQITTEEVYLCDSGGQYR